MTRPTASVFSVEKLWLTLVLALVAGSLLHQQEVEARFTSSHCPGLMGNRDIFEKVVWICDDCANVFRRNNVGSRCRRNCFLNEQFVWCVYNLERQAKLNQYMTWISILRAGMK